MKSKSSSSAVKVEYSIKPKSLANTNRASTKSKPVSSVIYAPWKQPLTLKHYKEVDVIHALLLNDTMINTTKTLALNYNPRISDYLNSRDLTYRQFRLIQFVAGASPGNAQQILNYRDFQSVAMFSPRKYPFLNQTIQSLYNEYVELYLHLTSATQRASDQSFFKKVRFMSALYSTDSIEDAANILSDDITTVKQFIQAEKIKLGNLTKLENEHIPHLLTGATSASQKTIDVTLDELQRLAETDEILLDGAKNAVSNNASLVDFVQSKMSFFGNEDNFDLFDDLEADTIVNSSSTSSLPL